LRTATLSRARLDHLVTHRRPGNDRGPPRRPRGPHSMESRPVAVGPGHQIDTTQIYASIRLAQLKCVVGFYEEKAPRMLGG
jgi:hypothetical protein